MTPPDDLIRLQHLRDAADKAIAFSEGRDRAALDTDEMLRLALTKLVEIVGEAAKQVSPATQGEFPDVPWSEAAKMRDRLVHHYFDIDLDVLWITIQDDLPALLALLPNPTEGDQESIDERLEGAIEREDLDGLRSLADTGSQDAVDALVELAGERGDLEELRRLADTGHRDAVDQLVELAAKRDDRDELRRLAGRGSQDAADVLAELEAE